MSKEQLKKTIKRVNELITKALSKDALGGLDEAEIKELQTLSKQLEQVQKENAEKKNKQFNEEVIDEQASIAVALAFGKEALKVAKQKLDKQKPLDVKLKEMRAQAEELQKSFKQIAPHLEAEQERLKEKRIQEEYLRKYNQPL